MLRKFSRWPLPAPSPAGTGLKHRACRSARRMHERDRRFRDGRPRLDPNDQGRPAAQVERPPDVGRTASRRLGPFCNASSAVAPAVQHEAPAMKAVLTKVRSLGVVGIAILASCGSSNHFGVAPGGSEGSSGAGGSSAGEDDSGAIFQRPSGGSGVGQFAPGQMDGSVPFTDPDSGGTVLTPQSIDQCTTGAPSGLSAASVKALLAGGSAGNLRYLYPYAGTVFPRGLIAPTLMWDGGNADYVYVHIKSKSLRVQGLPRAHGRRTGPLATRRVDGGRRSRARGLGSFCVSHSRSSPEARSPVPSPSRRDRPGDAQGLRLLQHVLDECSLSGGPLRRRVAARVLRIVPGQTAQVFLGQSGCTGCHAVSANGTRMVAEPLSNPFSGTGDGATYALTTTRRPTRRRSWPRRRTRRSPASRPMARSTSAARTRTGPEARAPAAPVRWDLTDAALYETNTGNAVNGSGIPTGAMMPTFSPDGSRLAFTDYAISNGTGPRDDDLRHDGSKGERLQEALPGREQRELPWLAFLFAGQRRQSSSPLGSATDYSGGGVGTRSFGRRRWALGLTGAPAERSLRGRRGKRHLDRSSRRPWGSPSPADVSSNKTYLPFGASEELHHNYDPTVSPVAAGGYFWVFFDSYRHYGNQGLQRQLWGAAVDVSADGKYVTDPSHPAFYVTGQELGTGNHRAFTALDPCRADGRELHVGRRLLQRLLHGRHLRREDPALLERGRGLWRRVTCAAIPRSAASTASAPPRSPSSPRPSLLVHLSTRAMNDWRDGSLEPPQGIDSTAESTTEEKRLPGACL